MFNIQNSSNLKHSLFACQYKIYGFEYNKISLLVNRKE